MLFFRCKFLIHIFFTFTLIVLALSCGRGGDEGKVRASSTKESEKKIIINEEKRNLICNPQKVIEVLNNGELIVSRLKTEKNRLLIWNLENGREESSLYFPDEYYKISQNGKYLLNRLSYRRYQLIIFSEKQMTQTI